MANFLTLEQKMIFDQHFKELEFGKMSVGGHWETWEGESVFMYAEPFMRNGDLVWGETAPEYEI